MALTSRRSFLSKTAGLAAASMTAPGFAAAAAGPAFRISLAQWSLHKALFAKEMDHLDFAVRAKQEFGIEAVEYVNSFFKTKARDAEYLAEMNKRASDNGVSQLLIMIDGEGRLGDPDSAKRTKAVGNHHRWVQAAKDLGCHSIRVNAASGGEYDEQVRLAADGLRSLCEYADGYDINVIVENHGGLSSNGAWLASVMKTVDHPRCGTLPDFGNFRLGGGKEYDKYKGVAELMPFARAVSAKSYDFEGTGYETEDERDDATVDETKIDYRRMMKIVVDSGYSGWVGIEYEGSRLSEAHGILATKALLERVRDELA